MKHVEQKVLSRTNNTSSSATHEFEDTSFGLLSRHELAQLWLDHIGRDPLHGISFRHKEHEIVSGVISRIPELSVVPAFIEIGAGNRAKFEAHYPTGLLKLDRLQQGASVPPCPYGYIPQTYCGDQVAKYFKRTVQPGPYSGDGDPLDICVLTSLDLHESGYIMDVRPIGVIAVLDKDEVDYKIVAVLANDPAFRDIEDLHVNNSLIRKPLERLRHYFDNYKEPANFSTSQKSCRALLAIDEYSGKDAALEIIAAAHRDYREKYSEIVAQSERMKAITGILQKES